MSIHSITCFWKAYSNKTGTLCSSRPSESFGILILARLADLLLGDNYNIIKGHPLGWFTNIYFTFLNFT